MSLDKRTLNMGGVIHNEAQRNLCETSNLELFSEKFDCTLLDGLDCVLQLGWRIAFRCGGRGTGTLATHTREHTMGDWGIEEGDTLQFEYCKGATPVMKDGEQVKDDNGQPKTEYVWRTRRGVVQAALGWGVVMLEDDPTKPGSSRRRSFSVYDCQKCRNLVRVPVGMCGDGI